MRNLIVVVVASTTFAGVVHAEPFGLRALPYAEDSATAADETDPSGAMNVVRPDLRRHIVSYDSREAPGTIIIDPSNTHLYFLLGGGRAVQYGIGVGREGFEWSGVQQVSRKSEWPDWIPPQQMIARQPYLPRWVGGGPGNPLGARALYLGATDYRVHGTNDPSSIGKHVSSGCIRMMNEDVIDLYNRVPIGTKVIVLPDTRAAARARTAKTAFSAVRGVVAPTAAAPVAYRFHASNLY
jgi:lipoprotein-anchoring transpeptidase ErfK/SrfK